MSDAEPDPRLLQAQLDLANERLAHLQTLVERSATKKDFFVFFLCLMMLIMSGGFTLMYRIDRIGASSNLHWTGGTETKSLDGFAVPAVYKPGRD